MENKIMNQELLDKIYNEVIEKPKSYHFLCYGGSTIKMVDIDTHEKIFTCRFQGDDNWMTPACKECKGLEAESESLTDYQSTYNYGMQRLYDALSFALVGLISDEKSQILSQT